MNDRFKFRVWDKKDKCFLEYSLGDTFWYAPDGRACNRKITNLQWLKENGETPQQSTGLKDKNGKLIYEGDVLSYEIHRYKNGYSQPIVKTKFSGNFVHWSEEYLSWHVGIVPLRHAESEVEVIGNTYENKDLLENSNYNKQFFGNIWENPDLKGGE